MHGCALERLCGRVSSQAQRLFFAGLQCTGSAKVRSVPCVQSCKGTRRGLLGWESWAADISSGGRRKVRLCPYRSTACLLLFGCELQHVQCGGGRSLQSAWLCRRAALAQAVCCSWGCFVITTIGEKIRLHSNHSLTLSFLLSKPKATMHMQY